MIDAALCQKTHPPQARKFAQSRAVDWWDVEKRVGEPFIACATPLRPTARQIARWGEVTNPNVRFGSEANIHGRPRDVRFTPESRHRLGVLGCVRCAISGVATGMRAAALTELVARKRSGNNGV